MIVNLRHLRHVEMDSQILLGARREVGEALGETKGRDEKGCGALRLDLVDH